MKIRIARHTTDLDQIVAFYQNVLGLEILGSFKDHNQYDGVIMGLNNESWHLEFTASNEKPDHKPDEDDLLVFYTHSQVEYDQLLKKLKSGGIEEVSPKNPYWKENGTTFLDPDGFRVVITLSKS